jgi:2-polyprenyl-3-methyl-5-hydroxy-6-metoxy-1,4-benzoquinol methylase
MMRLLDAGAQPYLVGDKFSSGLDFKINDANWCANRFQLLEEAARGKCVLHIGCADHEGLIAEKHSHGAWLHGRLAAVARELYGVDIAPKAIEVARGLGFKDIYECDLTEEWPVVLRNRTFDLAVLGEMVEHLDDPIGFLRKLRLNADGRIGAIIVTVPNAWSAANAAFALRGVEFINTDHRFWFTPFTIAKVLTRAGWRLDKLWLGEPEAHGGLRGRVRAWVLENFLPQFAETIVVRAVPSS